MAESAIDYILRKIMFVIPHPLLNATYNKNDRVGIGYRRPITLEKQIETLFIRNQLLLDLQSLQGVEETIPLGGLPVTILPDMRMIVEVPMAYTGGRNILSPQRINYYYEDSYSSGIVGAGVGSNSGSTITLMENKIVDSNSPIPATGTTMCKLIAPNTILMDLGGQVPYWCSALCLIEKSPNLQGLTPSTFKKLANLALALCKAQIYYQLVVNVDEGTIAMGMELGAFKRTLDSYSDSYDTYQDLLIKWRKMEVTQDEEYMTKHSRLLTGGIG